MQRKISRIPNKQRFPKLWNQISMQTRQGDGRKPRKKYNRYGDDFVVDRIDLKKIVEEMVGL